VALARALVLAAMAWPLLLGGALWRRTHPSPSVWPSIVYAAASRVCHQRDDRSFHTAGIKWPVCARCTGLYLSAPLGALAALTRRRRPQRGARIALFAVAALATAWTLGIEWLGWGAPSHLTRAIAALPLGGVIAYLVVDAARPRAADRMT
jgi:hypothetical protein